MKLAIVALILAVIAVKLDFAEMGAAIAGANPVPVLLAVLLFVLNRVITAAKWDVLLRRHEIRAGLGRLIRIMFESSFLGMAIPSGLGVDIARLVQIRMEKHDLTSSAGSILADRILAVLTLAALSVIAAVFGGELGGDKKTLAVVVAVGVLVCATIMLLMSDFSLKVYALVHAALCGIVSRTRAGRTDPDSGLPGAVKQKVTEIHGSLAGLLKDPVAMGTVLGMNVVVQCVRIAQVHLLFLAIGESVPAPVLFAFVPMILLIKLLPISPYMGIGWQDGAFVLFFAMAGITKEISLAASILMHLVVIVGILPGAFLFFLGRGASSLKQVPRT